MVRLSGHGVDVCQVAPRVDRVLLAPACASRPAGLTGRDAIQAIVPETLRASRVQAIRDGLDIAIVDSDYSASNPAPRELRDLEVRKIRLLRELTTIEHKRRHLAREIKLKGIEVPWLKNR